MSTRHGRQGRGIATKCEDLKAYEQYAKQFIEAECPGKLKMKIDTSKGNMIVADELGRQGVGGTVSADRQLRYVHRIEVTQKWRGKVSGGKERVVTEDHLFWFDVTTALKDDLKMEIEKRWSLKREKAKA